MKDLDHSSQKKSVKESDFVAIIDSNKSAKKLAKIYSHETIKNRIKYEIREITVKHSVLVSMESAINIFVLD